jgi:hypothetical protein
MYDEAGGGGRGGGWAQKLYGLVSEEPVMLKTGSWFWVPMGRFQIYSVVCWALPGSRLLRVNAGQFYTVQQPRSKIILADIDLDRVAPAESIERFTGRVFTRKPGTIGSCSYVCGMRVHEPLCDMGGVELAGALPEVQLGYHVGVELRGACWALLLCGFEYVL